MSFFFKPRGGKSVPTSDSPDFSTTATDPYPIRPDTGANNPVLTESDVNDTLSNFGNGEKFVADPSLFLADNGTWHMFFEYSEVNTTNNAIGHATSNDGLSWTYDQIIVNQDPSEGFPVVWSDNSRGEYYMSKSGDSDGDGKPENQLLKATNFPTEWSQVTELGDTGGRHGDAAILKADDGNYYMWVADFSNGHTELWYNTGNVENNADWLEHSASPVYAGSYYQPSGRAIQYDSDGKIILFRDNDKEVRGFTVTTLSTSNYSESALESWPYVDGDASGWNANVMHQTDLWFNSGDEWLAAVDGYFTDSKNFTIGIYRNEPEAVTKATTLNDATDTIYAVRWSPNGSQLLANSGDTNAYVWDQTNFSLAQTLSDSSDRLLGADWSNTGGYVATGSWSTETTLRIYNTNGYSVDFSRTEGSGIRSVAFSPDDNYLAVQPRESDLVIYDISSSDPANWSQATTINSYTGDRLVQAAWSKNRSYIAVGTSDGAVRLVDVSDASASDWGLATNDPLSSNLSGNVFGVDWATDSRLFASDGTNDATVFDVTGPKVEAVISTSKSNGANECSVAGSPPHVAFSHDDGTFDVGAFSSTSEDATRTHEQTHNSGGLSRTVEQDASVNQIAVGGDDGNVTIWDAGYL